MNFRLAPGWLGRSESITWHPPDFDSARQTAWAFRAVYRELHPPPGDNAEVQAALASLGQELALDRTDADADGTGAAVIDQYNPRRFLERMEVLTRAVGAPSPE